MAQSNTWAWSTTNDTTSPGNQLVNAVGTTINTSTFVDGYNYVLFANVEANASGNIVFTGVAGDQLNGSDNNHRLGLNGLQIKRTDAMSTVEASPATVFADGVLTSSVTVTLRDANGNGVSGKEVTLANTSGPQAASINPLTAITTNLSGQAVFNVSSATHGIEIFTATNVTDTLTLTDTASVEFVEVGVLTDAAQSTVVASPIARLADGSSTSTITVTLRDANGYPVSAKDVTLANSGGPRQRRSAPSGRSLRIPVARPYFRLVQHTRGRGVHRHRYDRQHRCDADCDRELHRSERSQADQCEYRQHRPARPGRPRRRARRGLEYHCSILGYQLVPRQWHSLHRGLHQQRYRYWGASLRMHRPHPPNAQARHG